MSDDVERKPCPGCNGANLIPWFGTLCSWCQRFPAHVYPAASSPAAARAEIDRRPLKMLREDRRGNPVFDGRMAEAIERIGTLLDDEDLADYLEQVRAMTPEKVVERAGWTLEELELMKGRPEYESEHDRHRSRFAKEKS